MSEKETPQENEKVDIDNLKENFTDKQLEAFEKGWQPEEMWEGDPEDFKTAAEFLRTEKLYGKISTLNKTLKKVQSQYEKLKKGVNKITELNLENMKRSTQSQIDQLKAERRQAMEENDLVKTQEYNDAILKAEKILEDTTPEVIEEDGDEDTGYTDKDFIEYYRNTWSRSNKWYEEDDELRGIADTVFKNYMSENPDASPEELFNHISTKMKRFTKSDKKTQQRSVSSRSSGKKIRSKKSLADIPEEVREYAKASIEMMQKQGIENAEEVYLKEYFS